MLEIHVHALISGLSFVFLSAGYMLWQRQVTSLRATRPVYSRPVERLAAQATPTSGFGLQGLDAE